MFISFENLHDAKQVLQHDSGTRLKKMLLKNWGLSLFIAFNYQHELCEYQV